jgi:nitrite reductase (NO-forming)
VDFHAVTGPGGGAVRLSTLPGDVSELRAKLLHPGIFVYHCAFPDIPMHIAHGMYGLIVVEPEAGLPVVDHEFYLMQSEFYTDKGSRQQFVELAGAGHLSFSSRVRPFGAA